MGPLVPFIQAVTITQGANTVYSGAWTQTGPAVRTNIYNTNVANAGQPTNITLYFNETMDTASTPDMYYVYSTGPIETLPVTGTWSNNNTTYQVTDPTGSLLQAGVTAQITLAVGHFYDPSGNVLDGNPATIVSWNGDWKNYDFGLDQSYYFPLGGSVSLGPVTTFLNLTEQNCGYGAQYEGSYYVLAGGNLDLPPYVDVNKSNVILTVQHFFYPIFFGDYPNQIYTGYLNWEYGGRIWSNNMTWNENEINTITCASLNCGSSAQTPNPGPVVLAGPLSSFMTQPTPPSTPLPVFPSGGTKGYFTVIGGNGKENLTYETGLVGPSFTFLGNYVIGPTPTVTLTGTSTLSPTPTSTLTPVDTLTSTPSFTPTFTFTTTPTATIPPVMTFTPDTTNATSEGRQQSQGATFNNQVVVVGGKGSMLNDVWASSDGAHWAPLTQAAAFSGRYGHGLAVWNSQLWLTGGTDSVGVEGDVWSSMDGAAWNPVTQSTNTFGPRSGHTSVVFNGQLWVLGGIDSTGTARNDVWSTSDGSHWSHTTAPWPARYNHTTLVFNNMLWVIGGWNGTQLYNDVWYSSDGANWTRAKASANFTARYGQMSVVSGGYMFVIGGKDASGLLNDVWFSQNGEDWIPSQFPSGPGFSPRVFSSAVELNGQIYVMFGNDGQNKNDVWSSVSSVLPTPVSTFTPTPPPSTCPFLNSWTVSQPYGAALDGAGNIYVVDGSLDQVDIFNSQGVSQTPMVSGVLAQPMGVAVDGAGNVYVTDQGLNQVAVFNSQGSAQTQWGNTGHNSGQFEAPFGIAAYPPASSGLQANLVYVADQGNQRIQVFTAQGTPVTQWGTSGTSGGGTFSSPSGLALDASGNVLVADADTGLVQVFTSQGTWLEQWYATQGTPLLTAEFVAVGSNGLVYISDGFGSVGIFDESGDVLGFSQGTNISAFNGSEGIATGNGLWYLADNGNNQIDQFQSCPPAISPTPSPTITATYTPTFTPTNTDTFTVTQTDTYTFTSTPIPNLLYCTKVTSWGLGIFPGVVDINPNGNIYVGYDDYLKNEVYIFNPGGSQIGVYGNGITSSGVISGIAFDANGYSYVLHKGYFNSTVNVFDNNNASVTQWAGSNDGSAMDIAVCSSLNQVYVADSSNESINVFTLDGTPVTQLENSELVLPSSVAVDSSGNVYVADYATNLVDVFNSQGTWVNHWDVTQGTPLNSANHIALDNNGIVYVSDDGGNIAQYTFSGNFIGFYQAFSIPSEIAAGNGVWYVVNYLTEFVDEFAACSSAPPTQTPTYTSTPTLTPTATAVPIYCPETAYWYGTVMGLAVGPQGGVVYGADSSLGRVDVFNASGGLPTQFGGAQLDTPVGIGLDGSGNAYVTDNTNNTVSVFDFDGNFSNQWGGFGQSIGQFNGPAGIAVNAVTKQVYVVDEGNQRVQVFNTTGSSVTQWGTQGTGGNGNFLDPFGVALDTSGNVYVTDEGNNLVQVFTSQGVPVTQWDATQNTSLQTAAFIAVGSNGTVYVSDEEGSVGLFSTNGNFLGVSSGGNPAFMQAEGLATGNNVWCASDLSNGIIEEFNSCTNAPVPTMTPPPSPTAVNTPLPTSTPWQYSCPQLNSWNFGTNPLGIASDIPGNFYVTDSLSGQIDVFDSQGNSVKQLGSSGQIASPMGVALDLFGKVYATDTSNNLVDVFDTQGNIQQWPLTGFQGKSPQPVGIAVNSAISMVYVAESGTNRIQVLDFNGNAVTQWGVIGNEGNGKFAGLNGVALDNSGLVYTTDNITGLVQVFTAQGQFVRQWDATNGSGLLTADFISLDFQGFVYVTDGFGEIGIFGSFGNVIVSPQLGSQTGSGASEGIANSGGVWYVADAENNNVIQFGDCDLQTLLLNSFNPAATVTPTMTTTSTPTNTNTITTTVTPIPTITCTYTNTISITPTITNTYTNTITPTPTITNTYTNTITLTPTTTNTFTNTVTLTPTITDSFTNTITLTPTITNTYTNTITPTSTITNTFTNIITLTPTITKTFTSTITLTPTITNTYTNTITLTPTITNTITKTPTITNTITLTPTITNTITLTATITNTITKTPTITNTWTNTYTATNTFTKTLTITNTPAITNTITKTPTKTNTPTNTSTFDPTPTNTFTKTITLTYTNTIGSTPTRTWTGTPTKTWTITATYTKTPLPTNTYTWTITPSSTHTAIPTPCGYSSANLQLEEFTTSCATGRKQDEFAIINNGAAVTVSDITVKFWGYDTSGVSLVDSMIANGCLDNPTCYHGVSAVSASAVSFLPACGPSTTQMANWEFTVSNSDSSALSQGTSWVGFQTEVNRADSQNFVPGTADWYSPCISGSNYTTNAYYSLYLRGNLVSASGGTPPSCRPLPTCTPNGGKARRLPDEISTSTPTITPTAVPELIQSIEAAPNISTDQQPIQFKVSLSKSAQISLCLYSLAGEKVYNANMQGIPGENNLTWNLENNSHQSVASGLYIYVVTINDGFQSIRRIKKAIVIH